MGSGSQAKRSNNAVEHLSAGDPVAVKTAALGIRTTIGPMTGLPRQRRLKWIETSGNASITCMAGCKEALNCMN